MKKQKIFLYQMWASFSDAASWRRFDGWSLTETTPEEARRKLEQLYDAGYTGVSSEAYPVIGKMQAGQQVESAFYCTFYNEHGNSMREWGYIIAPDEDTARRLLQPEVDYQKSLEEEYEEAGK